MSLTVYGARYSVYSRILALTERGDAYRWVETDVFDTPADREAQGARHPFGKIPSIDHDGFTLYETAACLRDAESGALGPAKLTPDTPKARARTDQIIALLDVYGYRAMVWDVFVQNVWTPEAERDAAAIERGLTQSDTVLAKIERLGDWTEKDAMIGAPVSLGDVFLAPMIAYFTRAPAGADALTRRPRLSAWWAAWSSRPSMVATRYPIEAEAV